MVPSCLCVFVIFRCHQLVLSVVQLAQEDVSCHWGRSSVNSMTEKLAMLLGGKADFGLSVPVDSASIQLYFDSAVLQTLRCPMTLKKYGSITASLITTEMMFTFPVLMEGKKKKKTTKKTPVDSKLTYNGREAF